MFPAPMPSARRIVDELPGLPTGKPAERVLINRYLEART
jgi:hypothetical protein